MSKTKPWHWVLGVPASLIALWLLLQIPIEIGAASVYEEKKPEMISIVDGKVERLELRMEPRLQAIEGEQSAQRKMTEESLVILRKLDPDGS